MRGGEGCRLPARRALKHMLKSSSRAWARHQLPACPSGPRADEEPSAPGGECREAGAAPAPRAAFQNIPGPSGGRSLPSLPPPPPPRPPPPPPPPFPEGTRPGNAQRPPDTCSPGAQPSRSPQLCVTFPLCHHGQEAISVLKRIFCCWFCLLFWLFGGFFFQKKCSF